MIIRSLKYLYSSCLELAEHEISIMTLGPKADSLHYNTHSIITWSLETRWTAEFTLRRQRLHCGWEGGRQPWKTITEHVVQFWAWKLPGGVLIFCLWCTQQKWEYSSRYFSIPHWQSTGHGGALSPQAGSQSRMLRGRTQLTITPEAGCIIHRKGRSLSKTYLSHDALQATWDKWFQWKVSSENSFDWKWRRKKVIDCKIHKTAMFSYSQLNRRQSLAYSVTVCVWYAQALWSMGLWHQRLERKVRKALPVKRCNPTNGKTKKPLHPYKETQ